MITFTKADWIAFLDMLRNPPVPTERMKNAAALVKKIMAKESK